MIKKGIPPAIKTELSHDKSLAELIINTLEISAESNDWIHREEVLINYSAFRVYFTRYLKRYNAKAGCEKSFTFSHIGDQNYRIWRLR